ncbi:Asparagine synthetase [glutamine-hydrolyzing] 1, partial [Linum perenne]
NRLKHRGPDWSGLYQHGDCYLAHQRLAIIDPASGDQPLFNEDKAIVVTVNGEIYNHEELRKRLPSHKFRTGSDCDVIAHLYEEYGEDFVNLLDGMFSFVLLDTRDNSFIVARDGTGITSLYIGWGLDGSIWISSELKGLNDDCEHFECFPPGHLYSSKSASTPMFLMSRKIKSLGVKMVLSGEGSDEVFGGYLYFHKAPNKEEFHRETCRKIKALHQYDCLRANKATSAWGLEARVPFLDKEFINVAMSIDPQWKMIKPEEGRIEKWVLRKAFDDEEHPYLPKHILYRQKEQFSDGVGYSWIDGLKAHASQHVTDKMMRNAVHIFPHNTPNTKEAYYYRMIFERFFPQNSASLTVPGGASVACSTATAVEWDASWSGNMDPSGRAALGVHLSAYTSAANSGIMPQPKRINSMSRMIETNAAKELAIQS